MQYKGKHINPYESFYWNTTQEFFRGELGEGIARCVKCDDSLATMVMDEAKKMEMNENGTSNTLTGVQKDNLVFEPSIIQAGYVKEGKHQQDFVQHEDGICRTICTGTHASTPHLLKTKVSVPQVLNPLKGQTDNGWHYEQQVYADYGITRAMKAGGGSGNIPKVISELTPKYRIRKLTPKECFRLMGVDDEDIDTIQSSGISNSSQYKLAGNSIVVDVLYHIFRKAFVEKENEAQQLTLF